MTAQRFDTFVSDGDETAKDEAFTTPREPARTALDELRDDLKKSVAREPITLPVKQRDGLSIRYSANLDGELLAGWRKRSMPRKGGMESFDDLKFSSLVLANQAEAVVRRGVDTGLNFRDSELHEMLGAGGALDAVRKMYGNDGHVLVAAAKVLEACGYSDELDVEEDPTTAR